jgi:site-specific recombinase XerD
MSVGHCRGESKESEIGGQRFISVLGKGRKRRNVEISDELLSEILDYVGDERAIHLLKTTGPRPD